MIELAVETGMLDEQAKAAWARSATIQRPTEDRFLLARHDLENRISVLMGGRAAEALIFGEVSTGASDDLQRATEIATEMVTRYGMNETVGPRTYAPPPQPFLTGNG
jgi:cell division protease FtsH